MGYSHNWTTSMPQGTTHAVMFQLECDLASRFSEHFRFDLGEGGALWLAHNSGEAEGLSIGPNPTGGMEFCKTGRGMAEIHIAEVLWRTAFAINDAGGDMRLRSDWTQAATNAAGELDHDAKLALAILFHQCADLVQGRDLRIVSVPTAWPRISDHNDVNRERITMMRATGHTQGQCRTLFAVESDGQPDYTRQVGSSDAQWMSTVNTHINMDVFEPAEKVLRGFLYNTVLLSVDGKPFVGGDQRFMDHPETIRRMIDLTPQVPDRAWLDSEIESRLQEAEA